MPLSVYAGGRAGGRRGGAAAGARRGRDADGDSDDGRRPAARGRRGASGAPTRAAARSGFKIAFLWLHDGEHGDLMKNSMAICENISPQT